MIIAYLLKSSRPLSWINTAYPFAASYLLAGGGFDVTLVVGTVFFLIPYNLALYGINDVFDYASDLANPRKGGAEGALLPPSMHKPVIIASVVACAPFLVFLVLAGGWSSWLALGMSLAALVAYSAPGLRFKEIPVLDSLTSSLHFVTPAVYALTLTDGPLGHHAIIALSAFFLWGMASHAFGAVQDIEPDTQAGIASVATAFGAKATVRFAMGSWAAAGLLVATLGWPIAVVGLFVVPYLLLAAPFINLSNQQAAHAHAGWRHFLWINYAVGAALTVLLLVTYGPL